MSSIASARSAVFSTLFDLDGESRVAKRLDSFITWLIIANLLALSLEHFPVYSGNEYWFGLFDEVSIYLFTVEYVLRLLQPAATPHSGGKERQPSDKP